MWRVAEIWRQGLPYGSRLPANADADDGAERGAIMLLVNADIARQLEFVQKVWINDGDFAGLGNDKDPMIGGNDGTGTFTIPRAKAMTRQSKLLEKSCTLIRLHTRRRICHSFSQTARRSSAITGARSHPRKVIAATRVHVFGISIASRTHGAKT